MLYTIAVKNPFRYVPVLGKILSLLKGINIPPIYLAIPLFLSLLSAMFEGMSLGLLIPILQGFLNHDFSFITLIPGLKYVIALLPPQILQDDRMLFGILLSIFVTAVLLKNVLRYLSIVSTAYFNSRTLHYLRKTIFSRYLRFGKLYFDSTNVGHNSTVLMQFPEMALWPLQTVSVFVNNILSLIVYLIIMSIISWKLTAFALPMFAILHFSVRHVIREIGRISKAITTQGSALGKKTVEILSTIPLVKAYSAEHQEVARFSRISDNKSQLDFRASRLREIVPPFNEMITLLAVIILFLGMFYFSVHEKTSSSLSFLVYFYLVLNTSNKFGSLMNFRGTLANATGPVDELINVFRDDDKFFFPEGKRTFHQLKQGIELRHLSFHYPNRGEVLTDISFTIPQGKMVAIVGPTGSGKSTLIHLIMRFYDCSPGTLFLDGTDIRSFTFSSLHAHMALVSQETLLLHDTLRYNITYGLDQVSEEALNRAIEQARLTDFVAQLPQGVDTLIGDRGIKLSGGEKQRVSIARALLKQADILILDEATSALDSHTEKMIQEAIDCAIRDRTSIVIAHRLSTIRHADKIVVLEQGRIIEEGTLQELLERKQAFFRLWEDQKFL